MSINKKVAKLTLKVAKRNDNKFNFTKAYLEKILIPENVEEIKLAKEIYTKTIKPYKFLFLNGRARAHRKYLLKLFQLTLYSYILF